MEAFGAEEAEGGNICQGTTGKDTSSRGGKRFCNESLN